MEFIIFLVTIPVLMIPMIWGGYLAFMRHPFVAVLFMVFYWPALWVWGLAECIIQVLEILTSKSAGDEVE
jgi:hypothetical protein